VIAGVFLGPSDLALIALPWSHIMAVSIALYGLMAGIRGCFLNRFDAAGALETIERYGVTTFVGVPEMFVRLVNANPEPARLRSVRAVALGQRSPARRGLAAVCGSSALCCGCREACAFLLCC
jgi:acyl-CoA synthetase (AMP-forming)/AMP-acid ligase II